MKPSLFLAAAAAALTLAAPALSAHPSTKHHRWQQMTTSERRAVVAREIRSDRQTIRWWLRHRQRFPESSVAAFVRCRAIGVRAPTPICAAGRHLRHALTIKGRIDRRLAAEREARLLAAFPPHHALWVCISRYEGGVASVNPNGHYGMLQMHADWGYGTSSHASDDPQAVQEWAAERAYVASGQSRSFLDGQWFNYDGAAGDCLRYA